MTSRPYLNDGTDFDLGVVESETISANRTLVNLSDTGGETKNVELAALLSGERTISITGSKKFATYGDKDTFTQRMDALLQGTKTSSVKYYPFSVNNCYAGQAYYTVFITHVEYTMSQTEEYFAGGQGAVVVHYTLEMKEGLGVSGA